MFIRIAVIYNYSEDIYSQLTKHLSKNISIKAKIKLRLSNMPDMNSKVCVSMVGCKGNIRSDTFKLNNR